MAFYFPAAHAQIDWVRGYTFLDQELRAVVKDAELGKRYVDKLVKVTRQSGQEDWIYIHIEVQGSAQAEFAKRMFVYNYRLYDRYQQPIASMAVLADETASWGTPAPLKPKPWAANITSNSRPPSSSTIGIRKRHCSRKPTPSRWLHWRTS